MLTPNDSNQESSIVANVYDMTGPGRYIIQVQYDLPNGTVITSNQLTVTVTQ